MREDFHSQGRHVIDATIGLRRVPLMTSTASSFLRSRDTIDLSNLGGILAGEAGDGLTRAQRHTRKRRDTVYIIISFIGLDI